VDLQGSRASQERVVSPPLITMRGQASPKDTF
jgi:hypothetical protein